MHTFIRKIKRAVLLAAVSALPVISCAQDPVADLEHIRGILKNARSFFAEIHTEVEYTAESQNDPDIPRSFETIIKIDGDNYYYQNRMASLLVNQNWVVGVMHDQKQIVYGRNNPKELQKARKKALEKEMPTDPALAAKAVFMGESNHIKHYRIHAPGNGLRQTDMYISTATGFFSRLVNEYADPAKTGVVRTVTEFKQFNDKAGFRADEFSEKQFLRFSGKTVQPADAYKAYRLIYTDPELLNNF